MTKICPNPEKFNMLAEKVDLDALIGHLFVFDIDFNFEKAAAKTLMYNEIYTLISKKQKMIDPTEKSIFQLSETLQMADENILPFQVTRKCHVIMLHEELIPLYHEYLSFLINRTG